MMRLCLGLLALIVVAAGGTAAAQPGQVYDPNAPTAPPPEAAPPPPQQPESYPQPQPYPPAYGTPTPSPMPATTSAGVPPNMTRATFVSTGETRWDVRVDGNAACTTPCALFVEPMRYVTLHSQDRTPTKLTVGVMPQGDVLVRAKPRANGAFAAGVTFTTLSGMGLATGITLTAVGYGTDREAMARAGLITAVPSAIGLYLSIGLIRRSLPRVRVERAQPYVTGNTVGVIGRF